MKTDLSDVPQISNDIARIISQGRPPSDDEEAIADRDIAAACAAMRDRKAEQQDAEGRWQVPEVAAPCPRKANNIA